MLCAIQFLVLGFLATKCLTVPSDAARATVNGLKAREVNLSDEDVNRLSSIIKRQAYDPSLFKRANQPITCTIEVDGELQPFWMSNCNRDLGIREWNCYTHDFWMETGSCGPTQHCVDRITQQGDPGSEEVPPDSFTFPGPNLAYCSDNQNYIKIAQTIVATQKRWVQTYERQSGPNHSVEAFTLNSMANGGLLMDSITVTAQASQISVGSFWQNLSSVSCKNCYHAQLTPIPDRATRIEIDLTIGPNSPVGLMLLDSI